MTVSKRCGEWRWTWVALWLLMGAASADEALPEISTIMPTEMPLRIVLDEGTSANRPANVTWIGFGGSVGGNDFPALSSDRSHIALLYEYGTPADEYPTFEIWSVKPLKLVRRIRLFSPSPYAGVDISTLQSEAAKAIKHHLVEINRTLVQGGYRSMERFFDFSDWKTVVAEKWGMRVAVEPMKTPSDGDILRVSPLQGGRDLLMLKLPRIIRQMGDDPMNSCGNVAYPSQGWYEPTLRVAVIRLINPGGSSDGCELPDQWLVKRL